MNHVSETNAAADAVEETPGPDHWTRDDIDGVIGALFAIEEHLSKLATLADAVNAAASAAPQKTG